MSARASLYAAAVLWGLAFGILVYRFGVMPLVWPSKMQVLLPGLAAGMFVGGLQIARMRPRDTVAASASSSMRARRSQPAPVLQMTGLFGVGFAATFAGLYALVPPLSQRVVEHADVLFVCEAELAPDAGVGGLLRIARGPPRYLGP